MRLYDSKLAPNPRRVRIFMAEKGVVCDVVPVDIVKGENLDEAFLAVNPRGLLPTLVLDDGTVLDESVGICRYLEEIHPEPPLLGTDPVDKAKVEARQRHMEFDGLFAAAFRPATARAAGETSTAVTAARGNSRASATARQPEPEPTSAMASRASRRPPNRSMAVSTISSVSGRGVSTAGPTAKASPQNSRRPVMQETGSRFSRRPASGA